MRAAIQPLDRYSRDLYERPHPLAAVGDHPLIEGAATGAIVPTVQRRGYAGLPRASTPSASRRPRR